MGFTHRFQTKFAAPPMVVFAALTDAGQLKRWFASHLEVDARADGAYRFWGNRTLGVPAAADATQRITELVPEATLAFTWTLHGIPTVVTFALTDNGKGTTFDLTHEVRGTLPVDRQHEYIDDFWRLQLGNLGVHLSGEGDFAICDFTDRKPEVRLTRTINAPRAEVWRTLIDPVRAAEWLSAPNIRITAEPGGEYRIGWEYKLDGRDVVGGSTKILAIEPGERLMLDWPDWRGDPNVPVQFIGFRLEGRGERTVLHFVHGGFTRPVDFSDYPFGWSWFLDQITAIATRPPAAT